MHEVGLREMQQDASDLLRRAEAGEQVTITVAGRPVAILGPIALGTWRRWDDIAGLFREPIDPGWDADRDLVDASVADPWELGQPGDSGHQRPDRR